jgi:hypothetical protein
MPASVVPVMNRWSALVPSARARPIWLLFVQYR